MFFLSRTNAPMAAGTRSRNAGVGLRKQQITHPPLLKLLQLSPRRQPNPVLGKTKITTPVDRKRPKDKFDSVAAGPRGSARRRAERQE